MLARLRKSDDDQGFTLIELLVVIMIIGILSAIAVPTFLNQRTKGYEKAAMAELAAIAIAQETLNTDTGSYGANAAALVPAGYRASSDVDLNVTFQTTTATTFLICASHEDGGQKFRITHLATSPTTLGASSTDATPCA